MKTVHHVVQVKRSSYPTINRLMQTGTLRRQASQQLQHNAAPGTLYEARTLPLTALDDETLQYGAHRLRMDLHRLPTAESLALIQASPSYAQYSGLQDLSALLRSPSTTLRSAAAALEETVRQGRQLTEVASLIHADDLFEASWQTNKLTLQQIGDDWFCVLYFDVRCTQPGLIRRATEFSLDLGADPLVYASTPDGQRFITAPCALPLDGLRPRLSGPARHLLDCISFAQHQAELQRVANRLCRDASIVYAEDLRYRGMHDGFVRISRRNGVLDFQESWLHNRLQILGIPMEKINPRDTSRRCSFCPDHPYGLRRGNLFTCHCCGRTVNAHYNATRNTTRLGRAKARRWGTAVKSAQGRIDPASLENR